MLFSKFEMKNIGFIHNYQAMSSQTNFLDTNISIDMFSKFISDIMQQFFRLFQKHRSINCTIKFKNNSILKQFQVKEISQIHHPLETFESSVFGRVIYSAFLLSLLEAKGSQDFLIFTFILHRPKNGNSEFCRPKYN